MRPQDKLRGRNEKPHNGGGGPCYRGATFHCRGLKRAPFALVPAPALILEYPHLETVAIEENMTGGLGLMPQVSSGKVRRAIARYLRGDDYLRGRCCLGWRRVRRRQTDRTSTRLNSRHLGTSDAVF